MSARHLHTHKYFASAWLGYVYPFRLEHPGTAEAVNSSGEHVAHMRPLKSIAPQYFATQTCQSSSRLQGANVVPGCGDIKRGAHISALSFRRCRACVLL